MMARATRPFPTKPTSKSLIPVSLVDANGDALLPVVQQEPAEEAWETRQGLVTTGVVDTDPVTVGEVSFS
jgi:hypothetical protein